MLVRGLPYTRDSRTGGLFQASAPFEKASTMAPIKITGHATTKPIPTRMTISRPIDSRLMSVTTMDLGRTIGGIGAWMKSGETPREALNRNYSEHPSSYEGFPALCVAHSEPMMATMSFLLSTRSTTVRRVRFGKNGERMKMQASSEQAA